MIRPRSSPRLPRCWVIAISAILVAHLRKIVQVHQTQRRGSNHSPFQRKLFTSFPSRFDSMKLGSCTQFFEQRFGFFQVGGVEALGEPVVDFGELSRAPRRAYLASRAREAGSSALERVANRVTGTAAARSFPRFRSVGPSRRISRVFWDSRVHLIPRLGAFDKDIGLRPKPARIVEADDANADQIGTGRDLCIKRAAANWAEHASDFVAAVGFGDVVLRLAVGDTELRRRHPNCGDIGTAALPLTVAAMALQRKHRLSRTFVADSAA